MTIEDSNYEPGRVAYQGAAGAFSHEACMDLRPWDEAVGFETFEEAIAAVVSGDCQFAMIPVENTTVGTVEPAASMVREAGLVPVSEAWRPIRLALLGLQSARLSDIRTAESHPIALGQCGIALGEMKIMPITVFDTGGAAAAVAQGGDVSRAAVAPVRAAEVYGLQILRTDLQDKSDNRTRFLLLGRADA